MSIRTTIGASVALGLTLAGAAGAQSMAGMPGMDEHAMHAPASAKARQQIADVAKAAKSLESTSAATAAGYTPVFGWIPTMGVHWVDQRRMVKSEQSNPLAPDNLMFSRINGRDSLVGAAYAYFGPVNDSTRPSLFDGNPAWHEHENLAPPGETLTMLHVWFVPSPDGPFAGTNPNLPYWAAGLAAPDSARMHDAAFSSRVRRAALALSEVVDTAAIFPNLEQRPDVHAAVAPRRDSVRALIPQLLAAQNTHDAAKWDAVDAKLADQWDGMYAAYVKTARTANGKERIENFVAMLLGQHHE